MNTNFCIPSLRLSTTDFSKFKIKWYHVWLETHQSGLSEPVKLLPSLKGAAWWKMWYRLFDRQNGDNDFLKPRRKLGFTWRAIFHNENSKTKQRYWQPQCSRRTTKNWRNSAEATLSNKGSKFFHTLRPLPSVTLFLFIFPFVLFLPLFSSNGRQSL